MVPGPWAMFGRCPNLRPRWSSLAHADARPAFVPFPALPCSSITCGGDLDKVIDTPSFPQTVPTKRSARDACGRIYCLWGMESTAHGLVVLPSLDAAHSLHYATHSRLISVEANAKADVTQP